ncbi:unnamed protein product [Symbiodinium natans]|uniref:Uncharacterized protein n=1 Tax=Symbiodinium natans TaxID=878477 RepID=A0A812JYG8_9DINO|nr:unnamed protein product [Symbiodinium natans]
MRTSSKVKRLSEHAHLTLGAEEWLGAALQGDSAQVPYSLHSLCASSSSSESEHGHEGLGGLGSLDALSFGTSEKFRAKGKHAVLAYLQRLSQQNAELLARMEALETRQPEPRAKLRTPSAPAAAREASVRRRPGEELSPTPLPREACRDVESPLELRSTSQKDAETCTPVSASLEQRRELLKKAQSEARARPEPALEQRRELLKKARDDHARVRAELRQQDNDRGHYSDCDPLNSEVKKLQEARKLLRNRPE